MQEVCWNILETHIWLGCILTLYGRIRSWSISSEIKSQAFRVLWCWHARWRYLIINLTLKLLKLFLEGLKKKTSFKILQCTRLMLFCSFPLIIYHKFYHLKHEEIILLTDVIYWKDVYKKKQLKLIEIILNKTLRNKIPQYTKSITSISQFDWKDKWFWLHS